METNNYLSLLQQRYDLEGKWALHNMKADTLHDMLLNAGTSAGITIKIHWSNSVEEVLLTNKEDADFIQFIVNGLYEHCRKKAREAETELADFKRKNAQL